jgi:protein involved in polysaccharide export with SLBB domain
MRKKTHKPALLFFFILLMSALLVGSAAAKTEADNPCDGPYKDTAKKYGVPCPEVKNEKPENRQSEKKQPEAETSGNGEKAEDNDEKNEKDIPVKEPIRPGLFERFTLENPDPALSPKLKLFGQGIFTGSDAAAQENLPVSTDYPVGYGDEIGVVFWGRANGEHILPVTREGTISIPMIGTVVVNGLTYGQVRELIKRKVEAVIGAEASVTMGRLRSIQVFVLGEVARPGAHKVNATSAVSNALMSAGGAASIGSLRKIELRREGEKPRQIDFYDLLLKGDKTGDARLKNGDVVFVPVTGAVAGVAGNVKRPALYEMKGATSLSEALLLAGGIVPEAYTQQVQVERIEGNKKRVVVDINASDSDKAKSFMLKDGDLVKVLSVTEKDTNAVYLNGNVKRPGRYELKPGMRLADLITGFSDLLEDTELSYGAIKRLTPELNTMVIPFNPGALLGGDEEENRQLLPLDSVYLFSTWTFRERPSVRIEGEVRQPGLFNMDKNLTVKDLVLLAGGLTKRASYGEYELYRKDRLTQEVTLSRHELDKALKGDAAENPVLSDSDVVRIHSAQETGPEKSVLIYGMVNNPGEYTYATNMRVTDLVFAGGGLKDSAYMKEAELATYEIEDGRTSKVSYRIIDLEKALNGDVEHNAPIMPYDSLFVREMTDWRSQQYVELKGEVRYPGKYVFKKGERLSSVIKRAGGFTDEAYLNGAVFTRESVQKLQQKNIEEAVNRLEMRLLSDASGMALGSIDEAGAKQAQAFLVMKMEMLNRLRSAEAQGRITMKLEDVKKFEGTNYDVALENGDTLFVPLRPTQVQVMGAVQNPAAFIYEHGEPISSYIGKAGGYNGDADKGRIFVLKTDGTAMSKSSSWLGTTGSFISSKLDPGDTVVVPEKLDKGLWLKEVKDLTQILYQIAVTAGVLIVTF